MKARFWILPILLVSCDENGSGFVVPGAGGGICAVSQATVAAPPQTITGNLANSDCRLAANDTRRADLYRVSVASGQTLTATLTSNAFTPAINLYNAAGGIVAAGDTLRDAVRQSVSFNTLAPGTYHVAATSRRTGALGGYVLELVVGTECLLATSSPAITLGQTIAGAFAAGDCLRAGTFADVYRLVLAASTNVRLELSSPAIDAFLTVVDAAGNVVSGNQVAGRNMLVTGTLLPGTYFVIPNAALAGQTGTYTLSAGQAP